MAKLKVPRGWVDKPWDGSASRWPDAESYCRACLIDLNPKGEEKVKELCALPVREPDGRYNVRAVFAAAGGRGITRLQKPEGVSMEAWRRARRQAARKLIQLYRMLGRTAPEAVYRIAGMKMPRR